MIVISSVRFQEKYGIRYKSAGNKIRTIRRRKEMTQEQLAEAASISVGYLSKIERASINNGFSCTTLMGIADALEIPECILWGRKRCPLYLELLNAIDAQEEEI